MLRCARELRVRRDLVDIDVDRAESLEIACDPAKAAGFRETGVPAQREECDVSRVVPVRLKRPNSWMVPSIALDNDAEQLATDSYVGRGADQRLARESGPVKLDVVNE